MTNKPRLLTSHSNAVLHIDFSGRKSLFSHSTHRAEDLFIKLKQLLSAVTDDERAALLHEGVPCELLEPGDPLWQRGRLRVCLQFIPDEETIESEENSIEFPLDEIRQTLNGANSIDG